MRVAIACIAGLLLAYGVAAARADDFNIAALPGLQWWASAQDSQLAQNPDGTGPVGNGDPVGFISDLSGNGRNAVMGNAIVSGGDAFRPQFATDVVGLSPGITYNGATAFSSLQSSFFQGDSAATLVLAVEGLPVDMSGRSFIGVQTDTIGFSNTHIPYAALELDNGASTLSVVGSAGIFTGIETAILVERFQSGPGGSSLDFWLNGVHAGTSTSSSPNSTIYAPAIPVLGNLNFGSGASFVTPSGHAGAFDFLEGFATNTALTDNQIANVYASLSQQWPGVQVQQYSPNVSWHVQDPQVPFPVGHIEGIAVGGGFRFTFQNGLLNKFDSNWNLVDSSASLGSLANGMHCGGGDYAAGKLFAPLEEDFGGAGQFIGVYDATKPGMPLITMKDISAPAHEFSGLCVVPNAGAHGVIFGSSYFANVGGGELWMYNYADGNVLSPDFGGFLGTLQLPSNVTGIQGVTWRAPYFYLSAVESYGNLVQRVLYQNGTLSSQVENIWQATGSVQGLCFEGSHILQTVQSGTATEYVVTLASAGFSQVNPATYCAWNTDNNGVFGSPANWSTPVPNSAGAAILLGGGATTEVRTGAVQVTVDAAYTAGSLTFDTINGTTYTLAGDGVAGHGLTLDSGSGSGASVNVYSGNHTISANLTLADAGGHLFNIASGSTLTVSGAIGETGGSRSLTMNDAGTLILAAANSYSGGTTVRFGTLQTTTSGALGSGPLTVNVMSGSSAAAVIGGAETVSGLAGTVQSGGSATVTVNPQASLSVAQSNSTSFQGNLVNSGTFSKSGSGVLEIDGAPTLNANSNMLINGGTLRFNLVGGSATVLGGVTATVTGSATLELAGAVSALSASNSAADRVNIVNSSNAATGGLYISGNNQQVGAIDGTGSVVVGTGADLTANHIIQSSLVIGSGGTFTLAPSDANGIPLDSTASGFVLAQSLSGAASMATANSTIVSLAGAVASGAAESAPPNALATNSPSLSVPEPDSAVSLILGAGAWLCGRHVRAIRGRFGRRRRRAQAVVSRVPL